MMILTCNLKIVPKHRHYKKLLKSVGGVQSVNREIFGPLMFNAKQTQNCKMHDTKHVYSLLSTLSP